MSRSRRKTPICGHTTAVSEKQDKRIANRSFRRTVRQQLGSRDADAVITDVREVSNVYSFDKDGKQFLHEPSEKDMRK